MALTKKQKSAFQYTKKRIKLLTKQLEQEALGKLNTAITCGALSEDSDFLKDNSLLARTLVGDAYAHHAIVMPEYRNEANNLRKFL